MNQMTIFDVIEHDFQSFKDNPGSKISNFSPNSKFAKKYLYPIYQHVKTLKTAADIEDYLYSRFFMGKGTYTPYADVYGFLTCGKEKVILNVSDFKEFIFVLNHCGLIYGRLTSIDNLIYPPNMRADDFRASLTDDDKQKIIDDLKRLESLHSYNPNQWEHTEFIMDDYGIKGDELNEST